MTADNHSGSHGGCHYLPELLAVRPEQLAEAREALREMGDVEEAPDRGREFFASTPDQVEPRNLVGLLEVADPHEAAAFLAHRETPIQASPIHGVGFEGHSGFMSGAGPEASDPLTPVESQDLVGVIAVVDSGIVREGLPNWMDDPAVLSDPADEETLDGGAPSHGTFVASVLRQLAPDHTVSMAAAPPDRQQRMVTSRAGDVVDPPTTELDVMAAIVRLVERHRSNPSVIRALNLSLGAEACSEGDGFLLTLSLALEYWRSQLGKNPPIFAAAGNGRSPKPVYPAAFSCVRGVAAGEGGKQKVWKDGVEDDALSRSWVDDVAPGLRLRGLSGTQEPETIWWSGSSFATAVATALSVTRSKFEVEDGITYWPDRQVEYAKVPGLQFE